MKLKDTFLYVGAGVAVTIAAWVAVFQDSGYKLELVGFYPNPKKLSSEIVSVQQKTNFAALSRADAGLIEIVDFSDIHNPKLVRVIEPKLTKDESLTSVNFHPDKPVVLVSVQSSKAGKRGRVEIIRTNSGKVVNKIDVGYTPDSIAITKDGKWALVANEGEQIRFNKKTKVFKKDPGSISILSLDNLKKVKHTEILVEVQLTNSGWTKLANDRYIERFVDLNGNGKKDKKADLNKNGKIEDLKVKIGSYHGSPVYANEDDGEELLFPLRGRNFFSVEPERVTISGDDRLAYVSVQEANGVIVVDIQKKRIVKKFGLGETAHLADLIFDKKVRIVQNGLFLREPDGIAVLPGGKFFITADEGDTDGLTNVGLKGGGRTVSIFDSETGTLVGDTGAQLDLQAAATKIYPDHRSEKKGSEPESVLVFEYKSQPYAVVTLERAHALALLDIGDVSAPLVLDVAPIVIQGETEHEPEGVDVVWQDGKPYFLTANEVSGAVAIFGLVE